MIIVNINVSDVSNFIPIYFSIKCDTSICICFYQKYQNFDWIQHSMIFFRIISQIVCTYVSTYLWKYVYRNIFHNFDIDSFDAGNGFESHLLTWVQTYIADVYLYVTKY